MTRFVQATHRSLDLGIEGLRRQDANDRIRKGRDLADRVASVEPTPPPAPPVRESAPSRRSPASSQADRGNTPPAPSTRPNAPGSGDRVIPLQRSPRGESRAAQLDRLDRAVEAALRGDARF
jgi:hypothetical protein